MSDLVDEETIWADESSPLLDEYGYDETVFGASEFTDELGDEAGEHDLACGLIGEAEPLDEAAPAGFADEESQPLTETAAEGVYATEFPQQEWQESAGEEGSEVGEIAGEGPDPGLLAAVMESGLSSEHTPDHDELPGSEQFDGPEHKDLGDRAAGPVQTVIMYGDPPRPLSFGDVVALAGDFYGDYYELARLSARAEGRREIAWARWRCLGLDRDGVPEPPATAEQKKAVRDRYFVLAASNVSHFSAGGSAYLTYTQGHAGALVDALEAGLTANDVIWRRALTKEAFADHFLTDSFSAGHVRTPRAEIRQWYSQHMPTSAEALIEYMARFIFDRLDERQQLPPLAWWYSWILRLWGTELLEGDVRRLGGEAVSVFTLGELVSLALHNHDNKGLDVVSNVDGDGHTVPGGYHWRAIGDNHLGIKRDAKPRPHAGSRRCPPPQFSPASALTSRMTSAAIVASLRELEKVRGAGRSLALQHAANVNRAEAIQTAIAHQFVVRDYIPRADASSPTNAALTSADGRPAPLEWRWGQLGEVTYRALDEAIRCQVASLLEGMGSDVPDPVVVTRAGMTFHVHGARAAFGSFVAHLRDKGIKAIEDAVDKHAR